MPRPGQNHRYGMAFRTSVAESIGHAILEAARQHKVSAAHVIALILESWHKEVYLPAAAKKGAKKDA